MRIDWLTVMAGRCKTDLLGRLYRRLVKSITQPLQHTKYVKLPGSGKFNIQFYLSFDPVLAGVRCVSRFRFAQQGNGRLIGTGTGNLTLGRVPRRGAHSVKVGGANSSLSPAVAPLALRGDATVKPCTGYGARNSPRTSLSSA
jgi:hypothetical protein